MSTEHASLVDLATKGEPVAVETLLTRHLPRLQAFIRLRCSPAIRELESCSDLAQSVCREVVADLDGFEYPGEAEFCGWMFTKAVHKIRGRARHHAAQKRDAARARPLGDDDIPYADFYADIATPSRIAIGREELRRVEEAFDQLPDDHREVLTLSRIAGLSNGEIASQTGRTIGSVRGLSQRAIIRLSWILGRREVEG